MPLSEHEQRMLDEMERNLYRHDADFVASVSGVRLRPNYRFVVFGALIALAGLGLVIAALVLHLALLGVIGFVVVLGGVVLATRTSAHAAATAQSSAAAPKVKRSFMDKMNDRWDRRTS